MEKVNTALRQHFREKIRVNSCLSVVRIPHTRRHVKCQQTLVETLEGILDQRLAFYLHYVALGAEVTP